jgi:hypothetical protein
MVIRNKNKVETFPIEVRGKVDEMFLQNKTIASVVKFLKQEHDISIDEDTLTSYRQMLFRDEAQAKNALTTQEVVADEDVKRVQLVSNKKDLLESLIADSYQRLQDIRRMNKRRYDPKWEGYITSYTETIRKIIETLSKLNEEFDNDSSKIDNIVKRHLTKLLRCVYETVKVVCPDKSIQFKQVLTEKYKELQ